LHNQALINLRVLSCLWVGRTELCACAEQKAALSSATSGHHIYPHNDKNRFGDTLEGRTVQVVKDHAWM